MSRGMGPVLYKIDRSIREIMQVQRSIRLRDQAVHLESPLSLHWKGSNGSLRTSWLAGGRRPQVEARNWRTSNTFLLVTRNSSFNPTTGYRLFNLTSTITHVQCQTISDLFINPIFTRNEHIYRKCNAAFEKEADHASL
jgi:hypothetical protein